MPISFHTVSRTHMIVSGNFQVEFDIDMSESQTKELIKLFGNDNVEKIQRIKWARQWLNIGLREAKEFVEQAQESARFGNWN